jgi:DNA-binding CsgD family transcriptional regulator
MTQVGTCPVAIADRERAAVCVRHALSMSRRWRLATIHARLEADRLGGSMTSIPSFDLLPERAKDCRDYASFRAVMMDHIAVSGVASACGLYLMDGDGKPRDIAMQGLPDPFLLRYEELGRGEDPVLRAVNQYQAPMHNLVVYTPAQWRAQPLYQHVNAPFGLENFMTIPVVEDERIVLTLQLGRGPRWAPFDQLDLLRCASLALRLSLLITRLRARWEGPHLTERELEVACFVAKGLTNGEIGRCLAISPNTVKAALKRVFAKLDVDSRAEMVARLHDGGWLQ